LTLSGGGLRRAPAIGAALLVALTAPAPLRAQLHRDAPIPAIGGVARGELLFGLGLSSSRGVSQPLSGLSGDLWSLADVAVDYGLTDRAMIGVRGPAWQILSITSRRPSSVPLDPSAEDGTATDAGDFRVTVAFAPFGARDGLSAGALVEVKLPTTNETRGIGPNTTDVTLGVIGSWGSRRLRATGSLGVAILEAPLESFVQNDLVAYALDVRFRATEGLELSTFSKGLANTHDIIPLGTEDLGVAGVSAEVRLGSWRVDAGVRRGYAGNSPDWTLSAGLAFVRAPGGGS